MAIKQQAKKKSLKAKRKFAYQRLKIEKELEKLVGEKYTKEIREAIKKLTHE